MLVLVLFPRWWYVHASETCHVIIYSLWSIMVLLDFEQQIAVKPTPPPSPPSSEMA
jgi:hypothetical protein